MSHSSVAAMTDRELAQLVLFRTRLDADAFLATWRPFAAGFLAEGLGTITLAGFPDGEDGIAFVSRNTWPEAAYRRAFPGGLAADGGGGAVAVAQGGVFSVHPAGAEPVAEARPDLDLCLALLALDDHEEADMAVAAVLAALADDPGRHVVVYRGEHASQRYHLAVTVHGPQGSGAASAAALRAATSASLGVARAVVLAGRELLSMTS